MELEKKRACKGSKTLFTKPILERREAFKLCSHYKACTGFGGMHLQNGRFQAEALVPFSELVLPPNQ